MQLDDARLIALGPIGTGRIARFAGIVCLVGDDPKRIATAALFDACRNHHGDGAGLIQKVAGILTRAAGASLPPFAIVAQDDEALLVAVHGSVTVLAEQPGGPLRIGGGEIGTWATSRVLDAAYLSAVTADGALGAIPALVDLQRGVAVADSFVVLADGVAPGDVRSSDTAAPAATPEPAPAPDQAAAPPDAVPDGARDDEPDSGPDTAERTPVAPAPAAPAPVASTPPAPADPEPEPWVSSSAALPAAAADEPVLPSWQPPLAGQTPLAAEPSSAPPAPPAQPPAPPSPPAAPSPAAPAAPAPSPSSGAAPANALGFESLAGGAFKIVELRPATPPPPVAPLPKATPATPVAAAHDETREMSGVVVRGVHCGRGHFNDPRARYCAVCGLAMFQNSLVLVEGSRPPLGVLLLNNGESYPLARHLVLGREPGHHPEVLAGEADVLVPSTNGPSLSRVHARIRLEGWDVHLIDEGSTNGTFVWDEPRRQWVRLAPQQVYVLRPGDQLAFGELTASFETSLQQ